MQGSHYRRQTDCNGGVRRTTDRPTVRVQWYEEARRLKSSHVAEVAEVAIHLLT